MPLSVIAAHPQTPPGVLARLAEHAVSEREHEHGRALLFALASNPSLPRDVLVRVFAGHTLMPGCPLPPGTHLTAGDLATISEGEPDDMAEWLLDRRMSLDGEDTLATLILDAAPQYAYLALVECQQPETLRRALRLVRPIGLASEREELARAKAFLGRGKSPSATRVRQLIAAGPHATAAAIAAGPDPQLRLTSAALEAFGDDLEVLQAVITHPHLPTAVRYPLATAWFTAHTAQHGRTHPPAALMGPLREAAKHGPAHAADAFLAHATWVNEAGTLALLAHRLDLNEDSWHKLVDLSALVTRGDWRYFWAAHLALYPGTTARRRETIVAKFGHGATTGPYAYAIQAPEAAGSDDPAIFGALLRADVLRERSGLRGRRLPMEGVIAASLTAPLAYLPDTGGDVLIALAGAHPNVAVHDLVEMAAGVAM